MTVPLVGVAASLALVAPPGVAAASPALGGPPHGQPAAKVPVAEGYGGAVSTVDLDASKAALSVLKRGGNAMDAAVAAAATLGVTEPYSAGLAGGGFLVYYDARRGKVISIDGREKAPQAMTETSFQENGAAIPFADAVTSGLSAGVPGSVAQWELALRRYGTFSLKQALQPAVDVASNGFTVDQTFYDQTAQNADRFAAFTSTAALYLPNGAPPPVGSVFRNPDLAATYRELGRRGGEWLYGGRLGEEVIATVKRPPVKPGSTRVVRPGLMELSDLRAYRALERPPTKVGYGPMEVYGMAPPSSGGSTVGEALKILQALPKVGLHEYLEASRLAFADRNKFVGDPAYVDVPLKELLSDGFAKERACLIGDVAMPNPAAPGSPDGSYAGCQFEGTAVPNGDPAPAKGAEGQAEKPEGPETTHLAVTDRWGNVAAYNITIEQTGGNGIVVPGRGFLLNNELTDFTFGPAPGDPNLPAPGKRPRSSMAPTIVLKHGRPLLAIGSPGGATIITTVLQILVNRYEFGMSLPDAVAAPRASQRNAAATQAEQAFIDRYGAELTARGHTLTLVPGPPVGEIGAATGLEFLGKGKVQAVAEPSRRGGGSALVVTPARP
ncbi:gamma-glutamyltransferase [Sphaerisporangium rhizosphaerae]|uniref:Glutathione hydrolase proenzyme n=1 Tax=Sphaerisporangium rhizosphaerae TaxID=2269375 RepID=A0ABW2PBC4_9ACTN